MVDFIALGPHLPLPFPLPPTLTQQQAHHVRQARRKSKAPEAAQVSDLVLATHLAFSRGHYSADQPST